MDGLRRYGHREPADRLARKFVGTVVKEFEEHGKIVEKYDVVRRESDVAAGIRFGYSANEVGFGWTNAAVLELLAGLAAPPPSPSAEALTRAQTATAGRAIVPAVACEASRLELEPQAELEVARLPVGRRRR